MMLLRLLGGISLHDPRGMRLDASVQRRRLALLAMLATSPRRAVGREKLLATLWPESDTARARNLLNQGVHALRRVLGEDALLAAGDELCLNRAHVWCDVAAFEEKLAAGDWEAAIELYTGPFLDGAHLCSTSEFEQWTDGERNRLTNDYQKVLERIADQAEAAGDSQRAVMVWRRLSVEEPLSTRVAMRFMRALEAAGDRAGAIMHAEAHTQLLRAELGLEPDAQLRSLAEKMRNRRVHEAESATHRDKGEVEVVLRSIAQPRQRKRSRRFVVASSMVFVSLAAAIVALTSARRARTADDIDPSVVLVAPFRVSGATTDLGYLREGMVDLLATILNGEGGPRAVDPRASLSAWRREAERSRADLTREQWLTLAHQLGAGMLLEGEVVGTPQRAVFSARLLQSDGSVEATARVAGPPDSLNTLVDRLTAALLSLASGEDHDRLPTLTTTSLPALRAYLEGQVSYRRGEFEIAVKHFDEALEQDSSFALAALGIANAAGWYDELDWSRGMEVATRHRDKLGARDRALLEAQGSFGSETRSATELLGATARAVQLAPDRPEAWYRWGELMLRIAGRLRLPEDRGVGYLKRAAELDPSFLPALIRLIELSVWARDIETAKHYGQLYESSATSDGHGPYVRWLLAIGGAQPTNLRAMRASMDTMPIEALDAIAASANRGGIGIEDAARANAIRRVRATSHRDREYALAHGAALALNRGRPAEASRLYDVMERDPFQIHWILRGRILDALYWEAELQPAQRAARQLEFIVAQPATDARLGRLQRASLCVLEQQRLWRGDASRTNETLRRVTAREVGSDVCVLLLRALKAVVIKAPDAAREVAQIEEFLAAGRLETPNFLPLAVSRLYQQLGDQEAALRALRRRRRLFPDIGFRSSSLREEGKLALALGDTAGAAWALREFLQLRVEPEAQARTEADSIRALLQQLTGNTHRR